MRDITFHDIPDRVTNNYKFFWWLFLILIYQRKIKITLVEQTQEETTK